MERLIAPDGYEKNLLDIFVSGYYEILFSLIAFNF